MAEAANADDVRLTRRQKFYNAYADYPLPFRNYLTQQFFPVAVVEIAVGLGLWAFFPDIFDGWTLLLLVGLLFWGALAAVLYPVYSYERRGKTIDKDMHLFVTRIGAMSTDDVSRQS